MISANIKFLYIVVLAKSLLLTLQLIDIFISVAV